ncbi:MAG: hypothetical protein PSV23_10345 [Brevundimonas sp.]|uniref:hypothetical protein n=1 Tax=Brevundimonas sp. TaxID=1871086 RepID=UPI002489DA98|nr:hypothetical protein [Brevundimonas sp.]MDI1327184.1 hypothetical protein [Brevundimonas sp.]
MVLRRFWATRSAAPIKMVGLGDDGYRVLFGLPDAYSRRIRTIVSTIDISDPDHLEENLGHRA